MAVVLIKECQSGIGLANAPALAGRGDTVYAPLVARPTEQCLRPVEHDALPIVVAPLDVTSAAGIREIVDDIVQPEGRHQCAVNNAGIDGVASSIDEIDEIDENVALRVMETNFCGLFRLTLVVLRTCARHDEGRSRHLHIRCTCTGAPPTAVASTRPPLIKGARMGPFPSARW